MRVAVVSCWKYRDAWRPFFELFHKFWPQWDNQLIDLITDDFDDGMDWPMENVYVVEDQPWSKILASYANDVNCEVLLLQEDFFLNAPVDIGLIGRAVRLMDREPIGAIRLYPCPGATEPSDDPYFGPVARHTMYRNSLQATIYRPGYLRAIAERYNTPQEFELEGSPWASTRLPAEVWAFKRELLPLVPISYECTAIVNGEWTQSALELCNKYNIEVDTSMRGTLTA